MRCFYGSGDDQFDSLTWTDNGKLLSVSSKNGCLYTFVVEDDRRRKPGTRGTHLASAVATQSISVAGFFAWFAVVVTVFVSCAASYFGVSAAEFLEAAFIDPVVL